MVEDSITILFSALVGAGGIGGVIIAAIKFSSDFLAERLARKYEHQLTKSLEKYKTQLGDGSYISRAMFDKEFEIYQSLSSTFSEAFYIMQVLHQINNSDQKIIQLKQIDSFNTKINEFVDSVKRGDVILEEQLENLRLSMNRKFVDYKQKLDASAPFIPYSNYEMFWKLYEQCHKYDIEKSNDEFVKIFEVRKDLQNKIHNYLITLTIIN